MCTVDMSTWVHFVIFFHHAPGVTSAAFAFPARGHPRARLPLIHNSRWKEIWSQRKGERGWPKTKLEIFFFSILTRDTCFQNEFLKGSSDSYSPFGEFYSLGNTICLRFPLRDRPGNGERCQNSPAVYFIRTPDYLQEGDTKKELWRY